MKYSNTLHISRQDAHSINPIISETSAHHTFHSVSHLLNHMGAIACEVADTGLSIPYIHLIFDSLSSAIDYEKQLLTKEA